MTSYSRSTLPDPETQAAFYDGIPAKRLFAWVIDVVIITALMLLWGVLTVTIAWWFWPLFWLATSFAYRSLTLSTGSATLGMRMMNIELRGPTGARLEGSEAVFHTAGYLICASFFLPHLASIAMIVMGPRNQSLPDMFLGTAAINRPR